MKVKFMRNKMRTALFCLTLGVCSVLLTAWSSADNFVGKAPSATAGQSEITVYGTMISSSAWAGSVNGYAGLYSFTTETAAQTVISPIQIMDELSISAGVYIDGKYYTFGMINDVGGGRTASYNYFDVATWTPRWNTPRLVEQLTGVPCDLTYIKDVGKVYGVAYNDGNSIYNLLVSYEFDENGGYSYETIGQFILDGEEHQMKTISSIEGRLYSISVDGILYELTSGPPSGVVLNRIGDTGLTPSAYYQSAEINPADGKLYWAADLATGSGDPCGLYEVSLTTGQATLISAFPNEEEFTGIFFTSDEITGSADHGYRIPFMEHFNTIDALTDWTLIDNDGDKHTWYFSYGSVHANTLGNGDDYMVSPQIYFSADSIYTMSHTLTGASLAEWTTIRTRIKMGKANTVAGLTKVIADRAIIPDTRAPRIYTDTIVVPESGYYYIAFQDYSADGTIAYSIDNFGVQVLAKSGAPSSPSDFTITPADLGEQKATITFKAPETTFNGGVLAGTMKFDIYRNNGATPAYTVSGINPGEEVSWVDNTPANYQMNSYRLAVSNTFGSGWELVDSAYVGIDTPYPVENIQLVDDNGKAVISWTPSNRGVHGGYVNPDAYQYHVVNSEGRTVASNITTTTYTDTSLPENYQVYTGYYVYAATQAGVSLPQSSRAITFGPALKTPFYESFGNARFNSLAWGQEVLRSTTNMAADYWTVRSNNRTAEPIMSSQDADGGMLHFNSGYLSGKASSRMVTPNVDITGLNRPVVRFWVYHYYRTGTGRDSLYVEVSVNDAPFTVLNGGEIEVQKSNGGWTFYEILLSEYRGAKKLNIGFRGVSGWTTPIYVDNISILQKVDFDLEVVSFTGPETVEIGTTNRYTANISNMGGTLQDGEYNIDLYCNDEKIDSKPGVFIQQSATAPFTFDVEAKIADAGNTNEYYFVIDCLKDEVASNDRSTVVSTTLSAPSYPTVTTLTGTLNADGVHLTWDAPTIPANTSAETVTETFDDYNPFTITGFGPWTTVDRDRQVPFGIDGVFFVNSTVPKAFIVFDAALTTPGVDDDEVWLDRSGTGRQLLCFDNPDSQNDDWLISGPLSENAQTLKFWAKTVDNTYGDERFHVYSSSTGKDIDDFALRSGPAPIEARATWKEYSYQLPEGSRYFAIQCVSVASFAFALDDITYEKGDGNWKLKIAGYDIYRNGVKINTTPLTSPTYVDTEEKTGAVYQVATVYNLGYSMFSNTATVGETSLGTINALGIRAYSEAGNIIIDGAEGRKISVITIDGRVISQHIGDAKTRIPVTNGMYLVRIDNAVAKILVK